MKKTVKIISTILLAIMLLTSISTVALAKVDLDKTLKGVESATGGDGEQIANVGGNIVNVIMARYFPYFELTTKAKAIATIHVLYCIIVSVET